MTQQEQDAVRLTIKTAGWAYIAEQMQGLVTQARYAAFSTNNPDEVMHKWYQVQAAQELWDAFQQIISLSEDQSSGLSSGE